MELKRKKQVHDFMKRIENDEEATKIFIEQLSFDENFHHNPVRLQQVSNQC